MQNEQMRQFVKQGLGTREVLQAVEDALVDAGYDDFMVVTERGSFHWMTAERARARAQEEDATNQPSHALGRLTAMFRAALSRRPR